MAESLEDVFVEHIEKLKELKTATILIKSKERFANDLIETQNEVASLKKYLDLARSDLDNMREKNDQLMNMSKLLVNLDDKIKHMEANIPPKLLQDYAKVQNNENKNSTIRTIESETPNNTCSGESNFSDDVLLEIKEKKVENCAKKLFDDSKAPIPTIKLIDEGEFLRIPKYMIGRQTLETVNQFVVVINQILKNKYSLIALGKNGARKKGEYDLFMSYIKQEKTDSKGDGRAYFFTAEDYLRHTKTKLDKTKLNLLTVLRHCARLREVRSAKDIQYTLKNS